MKICRQDEVMRFISIYLAPDKLLQKIAPEMLSKGVESCQYKLLNTILNSIEVYEEPVPGAKKVPHRAAKSRKVRIEEFYIKVCIDLFKNCQFRTHLITVKVKQAKSVIFQIRSSRIQLHSIGMC